MLQQMVSLVMLLEESEIEGLVLVKNENCQSAKVIKKDDTYFYELNFYEKSKKN